MTCGVGARKIWAGTVSIFANAKTALITTARSKASSTSCAVAPTAPGVIVSIYVVEVAPGDFIS